MVDRSAELLKSTPEVRSPTLEPEKRQNDEDFMKRIELVKVDLLELKKLVENVESSHQRYVQAVNSDFKEKYREALSTAIHTISELIVKVTRVLKEMDGELKGLEIKNLTNDNHYRLRLTQQGLTTQQFQEIVKKYNQIQISYKEKYELQIEKQYKIVNPAATKEEIQSVIKSGRAIFSVFIIYLV